jgi:hypothetical protein
LTGELEGQITPALAVVDIPLQGPGIWNLSTSSPSSNQLVCATSTREVQSYVALLNSENCQLQISPATMGTSLTWLLTPTP